MEVSGPGRFNPGERAPDIHCSGCWAGLRVGALVRSRIAVVQPLKLFIILRVTEESLGAELLVMNFVLLSQILI